MAVSREDVLHVAGLARLRLTASEVERLTVQLNSILEHMRALAEVEVEGVEAVGGAAEWEAPLRGKDVGPDALQLAPRALAPSWEDGFFTVPRLAALDTAELEEAFEDKAAAEPAGRPAPEDLPGAP
ncbi:MAG: Asp-tRNA(Asn)/Glu-tRNA(Gln) amidotransferase subunit GatC [Gemmatimonadetes bacterium]|nr:Asp-tRNA(Asn)/Glu-tRNA(Gln) amidotransferase subunit GatC [Gemmatimonadota bacterium]